MRTKGEMMADSNRLQLADWRRQIAELYGRIRHEVDPEQAWQLFRERRNELFRDHAQTPLDNAQRAAFIGLPTFAYDPAFRVIGRLDTAVPAETFAVELPADGLFRFTRIAAVHFELQGEALQLGLYWVEGYGGGLFLPFRDVSNGTETYGGGRYLYDSIKGADLGAGTDTLLLDFNFAYNPSCAYNDQWVCPLAPQENRLPVALRTGEKRFE